MLTVWSVCVGDKYSDEYVYRLAEMVRKHLKDTPYNFICLTDRGIPEINCYLSPVDWPGWWQKIYLFEAAKSLGGPNLYLDLDVVVVGDLSALISDQLSMPKNWAQSEHGGAQSSVMSWSGDYSDITRGFNPSLLAPQTLGNYGLYGPKKLWGDQEYITDKLGNPGQANIKAMPHIYSYKYHCRSGPPDDARVVCFHGNPKPHTVKDSWVLSARYSTR